MKEWNKTFISEATELCERSKKGFMRMANTTRPLHSDKECMWHKGRKINFFVLPFFDFFHSLLHSERVFGGIPLFLF